MNHEPDLKEVVQAVHILTGYDYKKILKMRIHDVCKVYNFVIYGLDDLSLKENALKGSKITAKQIQAGIEKLNKFGVLNSIKMVADFYNESLEEAEKRSYKNCFSIWLYNKEKSDYENNLKN